MKPIKNKLCKLSLSLFIAILVISLFAAGIDYANATGAASFPQDTTVALDVGNFTITAGSDADSVTTSNTQVTIGISSGQTFTLDSSNRYLLTINDSGYTYECLSDRSTITITSTTTKTVIITPSANVCGTNTGGGNSGGGGGGGTTSSSSVTPTPTPTPTPTESPSVSMPSSPSKSTIKPEQYNLKDGDVVSAGGSDDPDVYIVNAYGYKRLFLNPVIFNFYGHLGGFGKVKSIISATRDIFPTSGLFRNCEINDPKVYGVEVAGEDMGTLHWVNTTGAQAVADDSDFFKKVFCINNNEFGWYKQGTAYTSVNQIPAYSRKSVSKSSLPSVGVLGKVKVVNTVDWLNVRTSNSTSSAIITKILPGQEFSYTELKNGWYKIQKDSKDFGWVFGTYVVKL